jgi:hypothetical protein
LDQHSKLSLTRTCKRLFAVGLPQLYHTICLTWKVENTLDKQPHIASLLRTVVARPKLAASIQAIEFKSRGFTVYDDGELVDPRETSIFTTEDRQIFQDLFSGPQWPDPSEWGSPRYEHDQEKRFDLMLVAVLCQLPNLKSLCLGAYFMRNYHLSRLIRHAADPFPETTVFRNLEYMSLCIETDQFNSPEVFYPYVPLFMLPSLIGLPSLKTVYLMPIVQFSSSSLQDLPCATQVTTLRFKRIILDCMSVVALLEKSPNLTALECNFYSYDSDGWSILDCEVLMKDGLKGLAKTLKHLCLGLTPVNHPSNARILRDTTAAELQSSYIGAGLKYFSTLETLEIGLCVLLGWTIGGALPLANVLPQGLKTLTIRDDCWGLVGWEWTDEQCLKLLAGLLDQGWWRDTCPKLERINLRLVRSGFGDWGAASRERFRKLCGENGVEGRVRKELDDKDEDKDDLGSGKSRRREKMVELDSFFDN